MHALIATLGTDGDVYPFVALGEGLQARGHRVTLATMEPYAPLAERHGFGFIPLVSTETTQALLAIPDFWHPTRCVRVFAEWGGPLIAGQYEQLAGAIDGEDTVLVSSAGVLPARLVQEKLGVPNATIALQPWLLRTVHDMQRMPVGPPLGRWLPKLAKAAIWRTVDFIGDRATGPALNRVREEIGLPPIKQILQWWYSPDLVIALFPAWFGPPQPDWPAALRMTGFVMYGHGQSGDMPDDAEAFLNGGSPPIVFTAGTGMMHAEHLFRAAVEACQRLGRRGMLLTRYPEQLPERLPAEVRHFVFVPFGPLLPRAAAVVHHGGVGTTAQAMAAGTPQLIIPWAYDQPDNASRVRRLGVGDWIKSSHVDGQRLAERLRPLCDSSEIASQCRATAALFDGESPLEDTVNLIEKLASKGRVVAPGVPGTG